MQFNWTLLLVSLVVSSFESNVVLATPVDILSLSVPSSYLNTLLGYGKSLVSHKKNPSNSTLVIKEGILSANYNQTTSDEFELWLKKQTELSFERILENIGGIGLSLQNVSDGAVIASPSKSKPNYFYQWVRDAAITMDSLTEHLQDNKNDMNSEYSTKLRHAVESYIANNYKLQRIDNKSGTWKSGDSLGEPKFMVDSTPFDEHWGRPQRDGPGLRIITIASYIKYLIDNDLKVSHKDLPNIKYIYDNIIKQDLTYVINSWNKIGFDLWEEVNSFHFFTSITMLKALKMGMELATEFEDNDFLFRLRIAFTSLRLFILLESGFKDPKIPYIIETPSLLYTGERGGLDIGSVLGCLRSHNLDDNTDMITIPFPITDSAVMGSLIGLINDMKFRYPINHDKGGLNKGFALGRYPEDVYDGYGITEGNPWFIATASAAEFFFKLAHHLYDQKQDLIIPKEHYSFYSSIVSLDPNTEADSVVLPFDSDAFVKTTLSLLDYADSFLEIIKTHVDGDGHMSEQFNKYNGYMEGAEDLTWSYGSFWSALRWRKRARNTMDS